jgi:hypothetical protein
MVMKNTWTSWCVMLTFGCWCDAGWAVESGTSTSSHPYTNIAKRDAFGVNKPQPPQVLPPQHPTPAINTNNFKFTGISSINKSLQAHFVLNDPTKTPPVQYLSLGENGEHDQIKVLRIDEQKCSVRIILAGVEQDVSFATHGYNTSAPMPMTMPGQNGTRPGMPTVTPGATIVSPYSMGTASVQQGVNVMTQTPNSSRTAQTANQQERLRRSVSTPPALPPSPSGAAGGPALHDPNMETAE